MDLDINIFKFTLSYNSMKHCSTGVSHAELHNGRSLNITLDRSIPFATYKYNKCLEKPREWYKGSRTKNYEIGAEVTSRNYGVRDNWSRGKILQKLSLVTYLVEKENGCVYNNHINQLINPIVNENKEIVSQGDKIILEEPKYINYDVEQNEDIVKNNELDQEEGIEENVEKEDLGDIRIKRVIIPPDRLNL